MSEDIFREQRVEWWAKLSADDKAHMIAMVRDDPPALDDRAVKLLVGYGSPQGPAGVKWEHTQTEYAWFMPSLWAEFVRDQPEYRDRS